MTSAELLAYTQELLDPKPQPPGHAQAHDDACRDIDEGQAHE